MYFGIELMTCLAGLLGSFVPILSYSDSFWGVELFRSSAGRVSLVEVVGGSPAASTGPRKGDQIRTVNEEAARSGRFSQALSEIAPGGRAVFDGIRDGEPLYLSSVGGPPQIEAVLLIDWQPMTALISSGLLIGSIVTRWLKPAPRSGAFLVLLAGAGIVVAVVATEIGQRSIPYQTLWESDVPSLRIGHPRYRHPHDPSQTIHNMIDATVLLLGSILAVMGLISLMRRNRQTSVTAHS